MAFDTLYFPVFIICFLALFLSRRGPEERQWILTVTNIFFIATFFRSPAQSIPFVIFLFAGFVAVALSQRIPQRVILPLFIGFMIALFIYFKKYSLFSFLPYLHFPYVIVGLSYIFFRIVHLIVDIHQGAIKEKVSLLSYFNYVCFFPCFVSGPIQLYQEYRTSESRALRCSFLTRKAIDDALQRIIIGFFEVVVISAAFKALFDLKYQYLFEYCQNPAITLYRYLFCAAFFPAYVYWNFKGYTDIVIGIAGLIDFKLPENFNRPFSSANFLDFWSRWHITLSYWFKFYIFNPFLKFLVGRLKTPSHANYAGVVAFFLTFFLMGMWHGTTAAFYIYGLLLASGVAVNKLYQVSLAAIIGKKPYQRLCSQWLYACISRGLALSFFAVAVTCLWSDKNQLLILYHGFGASRLIAGFFMLAIIMAVFLMIAEKTVGLCNNLWMGFHPSIRNGIRYSGLAAMIFLISVVKIVSQTVPEIYYKLF
jgi:alginate O-acetyltransferase complex protein AlgI